MNGSLIPTQHDLETLQTEDLVATLEEHREALEAVADSDVLFADRAENALNWLDEHAEEAESGE